MTTIHFTVPGKPRGKQRPRVTRHGSYTPKETKAYEADVGVAFILAMRSAIADNLQGYTHDLKNIKFAEVYISAYFAVPQSWSETKKNGAYDMPFTGKPDADNIAKIILDGLNGYAYQDDACVIECDVSKRFCGRNELPRVEVTVTLECGF